MAVTGVPERFGLRPGVRLGLVAAVAVSLVSVTVLVPPTVAAGWGIVAGVVLGLAQAVALWWVDARPWPVFVAVLLAAAASYPLYPVVGAGGAMPALFALAGLRRPRYSLWGLVAVAGFVPVVAWYFGPQAGVITGCGALLAWTLGELNRVRERRRRELAVVAAAAERERIARELHDVVAHHVSVVVVQAAAADDVFDSRPDQARSAIRAIETTGRRALAELRRLVLDSPGAEPQPPGTEPGLSELEDLVASVRAAGLEVELRRDQVAVPDEVGLAARRIVQESLTNVVKHARATRVTVTVTAGDGELLVEVGDDGAGVGADPAPGRGIAGMRRRAEALGGSLDVGSDGGGFRVRAWLPLSR